MPVPFSDIGSANKRFAGSTQFLTSTKDQEPVLYLPFGKDAVPAFYMYESLNFAHPIGNGLSRYYPESYYAVKKNAEENNWKALKALGFKYLVLDKSQSSARPELTAVYEDSETAVSSL